MLSATIRSLNIMSQRVQSPKLLPTIQVGSLCGAPAFVHRLHAAVAGGGTAPFSTRLLRRRDLSSRLNRLTAIGFLLLIPLQIAYS